MYREEIKNIGDLMKIKEETYGIVWGTVLLVIGLIILLAALTNVLNVAQNPAETIEQWVLLGDPSLQIGGIGF